MGMPLLSNHLLLVWFVSIFDQTKMALQKTLEGLSGLPANLSDFEVRVLDPVVDASALQPFFPDYRKSEFNRRVGFWFEQQGY